MTIQIEIVSGPLKPMKTRPGKGIGASVTFEGVVRAIEAGKRIRALEYQVYEPMASKQLKLLAREIKARTGIRQLSVWHSEGRVPVGKVSFRLVIESAHRKEALDAMAEFIDRMKQDVPIWKKPVFARTKR